MKLCYIFDIDGTIANGSHRLHYIQKTPKDWSGYFAACDKDEPVFHIINLARACSAQASVIYVSGRSDECADLTRAWLRAHHLPSGTLYMRKAGDHRDDSILKIELLNQIRTDGFRPIMAFDDRDRVVAAWRAAGIPCAQVAPGDF